MASHNPHITVDCRLIRASGIGTVISSLLPRIIPLFRAHHPDIHFHLLGKPKELQEIPGLLQQGVTFIPCDAPLYSVKEQVMLSRLIPKQTSLFWAPHYVIPLTWRGRLLVTVHDVCHLSWPDYARFPRVLYPKAMLAAVAMKASQIICDSEFSRSELLNLTPARPQKTEVILCGVEEKWFTPPMAVNPFADQGPYMLFIGNIKPHKNLPRLLEAFAQIKDLLPHHRLLLVGKKEGFIGGDARVDALATALGSRVAFTGYVEDNVLHAILKGADFLVMPSLYEGFGLPPLEAMACGVPVLCSDAASLPEVCGDAALMCDARNTESLAQGMVKLATDASLKASLIEAGAARARAMTWQGPAHAYADTMLTLLE